MREARDCTRRFTSFHRTDRQHAIQGLEERVQAKRSGQALGAVVLPSCRRPQECSQVNAVTPQSTSMLIKASAAERFLGHLRLLRPANLVTSCADVLAGSMIVGAHDSSLFWRLSASVGLYAGGVALNDFFDRNIDGVEHPELSKVFAVT